ncbi:hypothetical protein DAPPUDRAFT_100168 [Daphnia pulex]|uniref:Uncharacterized protein n=1 Tax=Daphnia pulex TaxID=6669 RepID=E9G9L6_DAPPU|nr:hypothetical protein DAPPUDRAFT_100168 [Daphnia pulex]|eukprot:EFX83858.1 hypothetical protein DAPPUDRAFT_100168 [Daphnia pulex]
MGFGLFNKSEEKCRRIVKSSEEFFVTIDICSQPGLDQFYLGVVAKVIRFTTDKGTNVINALQPYKVFQYVKATPLLDQAEDLTPDPERTDDANVEIELDIEIADEESDDDDELLSDNESDDGNGNAEENEDPKADKDDDVYDSEQEHFRQAFPKRMT